MTKINLSLLAKTNIKLGNFFYKNGANFLNNFRGQKKWKKNISACYTTFEQADNMKFLHENGFTKPEFLFEKSLVNEVVAEFESVIENKNHSDFRDIYGVNNTDNEIASYWIKNSLSSMPSLKKLFTPEFVDLISGYYQSGFKLHSVEAWKTTHVSTKTLKRIYPAAPYSLFWHTDGHTVDTTKFFMVLSDVTEDNGPLHFLSKKRTADLFKKGFLNRFLSIDMKDEIESVDLHKLVGETGTGSFCNTPICLHRAGIPAEGNTRGILQFRFESSKAPFNVNDL